MAGRRKKKRMYSKDEYPFGRPPASNRSRRRRASKAEREFKRTARRLGF